MGWREGGGVASLGGVRDRLFWVRRRDGLLGGRNWRFGVARDDSLVVVVRDPQMMRLELWIISSRVLCAFKLVRSAHRIRCFGKAPVIKGGFVSVHG